MSRHPTDIVYLHGFRSSPRSTKARQIEERLIARGDDVDYLCPQLPVSPRDAAACIRSVIEERLARRRADRQLAVIGSSLGGYYATWVAERIGCDHVVLLNPAVHPDRDLAAHLGPQKVWHGDETIDVRPEFLDELRELAIGPITRPERYYLVAATGDELLDWREMVARYPGARQKVIEGSDHGLSDFADYIDGVIDFAIAGA